MLRLQALAPALRVCRASACHSALSRAAGQRTQDLEMTCLQAMVALAGRASACISLLVLCRAGRGSGELGTTFSVLGMAALVRRHAVKVLVH